MYFFLKVSSEMNPYTWILYSRDPKQTECLVIEFRHYCRLLATNYTKTSCVDGSSWTFSSLEKNGVTTDELVHWIIPFHLIEEYAVYLSKNRKMVTSGTVVCNCTRNRIGRRCEYELIATPKSPGDLLNRQMSVNGYETLTTYVDGITCEVNDQLLEWRHICDGIIQCRNGADESSCHLLEFHKCEENEFQCRNGMCIPSEFVFDAMPDCMDLSDEQELEEINQRYYDCSKKASLDCDDRLCRKDQFSCGNGDCVPWSAVLNNVQGCANFRHVAYLCQTFDVLVNLFREWIGICQQTVPSSPLLTNTSSCQSTLQHLLHNGNNPHLRKIALENIIDRCPETILYSEKNVLSPNLKLYYRRSYIESFYKNQSNFDKSIPRAPHLYCIGGKITCQGMSQVHFPTDYCMDYDKFQELISYPFLPISHLLCQWALNQTAMEIKNDSHYYPSSLPPSYQCQNTSDRLSLRRINDGFVDCLYGDDERNDDYAVTEPFRYQCQTVTSPLQYVSYAKLGNGINDCADGSDEISKELQWFSFKCDINDNYACWVLQGDRVKQNRIKNVRLHFHRYCDSVWDTMDGQDEINCSRWICKQDLYQCNRTGQCIDREYLCDGEFDCYDGEDELDCPPRSRRWTLEEQCHNGTEFFCINTKYLENRTLFRPCIPSSQVGDHHIDCIGARDERNVLSCSDHRMLGDRFLCDNQTKCVDYRSLCNGIYDCLDRTDELVCFWNVGWCPSGKFSCADFKGCKNSRCNTKEGCSDRSHRFWCPNSTSEYYTYRSNKNKRLIGSKERCYSQLFDREKRSLSLLLTDSNANDKTMALLIQDSYCNRGFYLSASDESEPFCFCPPTFYGNRCQFSTRRVALRVRFDRRHRSDLPIVLNVLVMLLLNDSDILDHHFFFDEDKDYPSKSDAYLIYPRSKLPGSYSVRIEAYHSTDLLFFWKYPISPLDFLPVLRIAKTLRFPDRALPWRCTNTYCKNNGTCYGGENGQYLCLCSRDWKGSLCEMKMDHVNCAPHSLARTDNICVCPHGYLEPNCFVQNLKCEQVECPLKEICFPLSVPYIYRHVCICNTSDCKTNRPVITFHRQLSNKLPFLVQLLQLVGDYPTIRQQILIRPFTQFPVIETIKTRDFRNNIGRLPQFGLLFTFEPNAYSVESILHLLFINCSSAPRNYTIDLDFQLHRCHVLSDNERYSVTLFRSFCLNSTYGSCFLSQSYLCYCDHSNISHSDCLSYEQRYMSCTYCSNRGHCVQGDLVNKTDFVCICPKCVTGLLCQFSLSRFSISLEFLIEKIDWGGYHFIVPVLFLLIGTIFNGFAILTFGHGKSRRTAVGLHLLANCLFSLLVLLFLCLRVIYLYILRRVQIPSEINENLCKSLPYLMYTFYYISLWLMAFITVERALNIVQLFRWPWLQKPRTAAIFILIISIIISGSNCMNINQYKLVRHPDDFFAWCVREIEPNQQLLTQSFSFIHQVIPFLINILAAVTLIATIARSKAHAHKKARRTTLMDQTRKRIDLLLGPIACFVMQMPEIIILFLNSCDYEDATWFFPFILITYYISFTPHISLFFLYVLPSKIYQNIFLNDTSLGKRIRHMFQRPAVFMEPKL